MLRFPKTYRSSVWRGTRISIRWSPHRPRSAFSAPSSGVAWSQDSPWDPNYTPEKAWWMYWVRMKSRSFAWHDITIHFPDWELGSTFPQSWPGGKKHTVNLVGCIPLSKWAVKCLFGSCFGVINHCKPCISGSCMSHVWLDPPLETRGMHIHPVTRSPLRSRSTAGHSCPVLRNH